MQLQKLLNLAKLMCAESKVMCYDGLSGDELEKMLWFAGTWIESFYHVDPASCVKDPECASKVLEMHCEVFALAFKGEYSIEIDEKIFKETVKKLMQINAIS
jgi:hypothetical protein|uniref:Uncharacterized protein n=1 Tax=Ignisphaera aggregans TaxID=334771 RepID=A0A7J2U265_9CREN